MQFDPFIRRLKSHSELHEDDVTTLTSLDHEVRDLEAGRYVVRERNEHGSCHVLLSGVAISHKINGDGGRQIISIFFPGELLNLESLFFNKSDQNIQVLRAACIATFPCQPLTEAMFDHSRISRALFRECLIKSAIARQWMTAKGVDAATSVAHLLCEIAIRLERCNSEPRERFDLPVNQEQIAQIVGVTPLHTGRVMRTLQTEGLIERRRKAVQIVNWNGLASRGDFQDDYLFLKKG